MVTVVALGCRARREVAHAGKSRRREVAATVTDPELPMLTLADLGVLRDVELADGAVIVTITPTYLGCPAMATMRDDLVHRLTGQRLRRRSGPGQPLPGVVERRHHGRAAARLWPSTASRLRAGRSRAAGPVDLTLIPARRAIACPRCGSREVELTSEFGPTACKAMYRCTACLEPFEHVKEI